MAQAERRLSSCSRWLLIGLLALCSCQMPDAPRPPEGPHLLVLGVAQDGGVPQAGTKDHPGWTHAAQRRLVVSLALLNPADGQRWLFEATPDLPRQLHHLDQHLPVAGKPGLAGIFLTHAHMGHYTGLAHLGHEAIGAQGTPVYVMPRFKAFLETNGPWDQLVRYGNIETRALTAGEPVVLTPNLRVTPFLVPHRQEYSEVVGYRIEGPNKAVLFIPDIDSWREWDDQGTRLEDVLRSVDVAYLDATFFANGEIPGRDMSGFPHPFITHTMERLAPLPTTERSKVRFIHLNHTNPALWDNTEARQQIKAQGFHVAEEGEWVEL